MKHVRAITQEPRAAAIFDRQALFDFFVEFLVQFEVEKTRKATADE